MTFFSSWQRLTRSLVVCEAVQILQLKNEEGVERQWRLTERLSRGLWRLSIFPQSCSCDRLPAPLTTSFRSTHQDCQSSGPTAPKLHHINWASLYGWHFEACSVNTSTETNLTTMNSLKGIVYPPKKVLPLKDHKKYIYFEEFVFVRSMEVKSTWKSMLFGSALSLSAKIQNTFC